MVARSIILAGLLPLFLQIQLSAQISDTAFTLAGVIYDETFHPLPATHVINMETHEGEVTDSLGIFVIGVRPTDTLMILNIAFQDTLLPVSQLMGNPRIVLRKRYYQLLEAKIFEWGATYSDFRNAMVHGPYQQTLGESLGLPTQDPDYIPLEMNPKAVKSPAFLIFSPVSFFYQNFNKEAKSARKVYWLNRNQEKIESFTKLISGENIASITGLSGQELLEFMAFLNERMACDYNCTELEILSEVYALWDAFREARGMN